MVRVTKGLIFLLLFCLLGKNYAYADTINEKSSEIVIDGELSDWDLMPGLTDKSGDASKLSQDLKEVRYFADSDYLYLYIERYEAAHNWDLWIPIGNAKGGSGSVFYPWENGNKDKQGWEWTSTYGVTYFSITATYSNGIMSVYPSLKGERLEGGNYINSDGTRFEVKLPLDKIGLAGPDKKVSFSVASDISQWSPVNVDWIYDEGFINIDKGPIFGGLTPIVVLSSFILVGLIARKNNLVSFSKK